VDDQDGVLVRLCAGGTCRHDVATSVGERMEAKQDEDWRCVPRHRKDRCGREKGNATWFRHRDRKVGRDDDEVNHDD